MATSGLISSAAPKNLISSRPAAPSESCTCAVSVISSLKRISPEGTA